MATHLSTDFSAQELRTFYAAVLLQAVMPRVLHGKFGQEVNVPLHYGPTILFRKFENITYTTTALTEGTSGATSAFTISTVTTSLPQYGQKIEGTDRLNDLAIDAIVTQVTEKLGQTAGDSLDHVTRAILIGGTNAVYAATYGRTTTGVASLLTVALLKKAAFNLKKRGAEPWVFGGKKRYPAITSPEAIYDLIADSTLATAMQYAYGNNLADNEANLLDGAIAPELDVMGVRLFETTNANAIFSTSGFSLGNVYCTLVFGKDAYGVVSQDSNSLKRYYIPCDVADKFDPLQQMWIMGWKAVHNAVILNQSNMVRIEHALSGDI